MQRFSGKVVVVTGAAQGIGRGVALRAAAEGGKVLFVDRADFVAEVAAEAPGGDTAGFVADLETYEGAHAAMAHAVRTFGRIDILINGVGGAIRMRPFAEFEPAQIDAEIRRSLMPTLYACHAVLPHLLARGGGTIVNISSNATRGIRRVPYSAAKGGVNALTSALAMEYAEHNIRVVATAPGGTSAPPPRAAQCGRRHRAGTGVDGRGRAAGDGIDVLQALQQPRRADRADPVLRVGRGELHHRHGAAGGGRRYGLKGVSLAIVSSTTAYGRRDDAGHGDNHA